MISSTGRAFQLTHAPGGIGAALAVLGLLASGSAEAVVCSIFGSTIAPSSGTCAEVGAGVFTGFGGNEGTPIPPNYAFSPTEGTASVIAGGLGSSATGTATAEVGTLRVRATAEYGGSDFSSGASAFSTAAFYDFGTIELPGGTIGDPVRAIVTVDIEGILFGKAFLDNSHLNFNTSRGGSPENVINADRPAGTYLLDAHVGDQIFTSLGLTVSAAADFATGFPLSSADFGNTARLFIDFQEEGVFFSSNSGHDYSSAAVVPAPPALWLLVTALTGLGGRRWLRRKAGSQRQP